MMREDKSNTKQNSSVGITDEKAAYDIQNVLRTRTEYGGESSIAHNCAPEELKKTCTAEKDRALWRSPLVKWVPKAVRPQGKCSYLSGKRTEPSSLRIEAQPGMRRTPAAENESAPNFAGRAFGGFCPLLFCIGGKREWSR